MKKKQCTKCPRILWTRLLDPLCWKHRAKPVKPPKPPKLKKQKAEAPAKPEKKKARGDRS